MVILPPLSEDRSIQILQLLTPLETGITIRIWFNNCHKIGILRGWAWAISVKSEILDKKRIEACRINLQGWYIVWINIIVLG